MQITNFTLPQTKLCVVVWFRNGKRSETLIDTPRTNESLVLTMLGHRVGRSEIRAVKGVDASNLIRSRV